MTKSIAQHLIEATAKLQNSSESPRLDSEILLGHAISKSRFFLFSYPEYVVSTEEEKYFFELLIKREDGMPIAYILGKKEFWSLTLKVTRATLIPRPETEILVEQALRLFSQEKSIMVADLGTGSGAIALALASERPHWKITAIDKSSEALEIAKQNAILLNLSQVVFLQSDWCAAISNCKFDLIISNPPYIAEQDPHLLQRELQYEPQSALVSGEQGLEDLQNIISETYVLLNPLGYLLLEHGFEQASFVKAMMEKHGFVEIETVSDMSGLPRICIGRRPNFLENYLSI